MGGDYDLGAFWIFNNTVAFEAEYWRHRHHILYLHTFFHIEYFAEIFKNQNHKTENSCIISNLLKKKKKNRNMNLTSLTKLSKGDVKETMKTYYVKILHSHVFLKFVNAQMRISGEKFRAASFSGAGCSHRWDVHENVHFFFFFFRIYF